MRQELLLGECLTTAPSALRRRLISRSDVKAPQAPAAAKSRRVPRRPGLED